MKLSSIIIAGMHNVSKKTYDLSNFNYLHGRNGAGKSTVMQAIQLALLGYIPGTAKRKDDIFKHANGNEMLVNLLIKDGGKNICICRKWYRKGKDIVAEVTTSPDEYPIESIIGDLKLPILDFNEFIGMSANKLKDWFIDFLPGADSEIKWSVKLNHAIRGFGKILDIDFVEETIRYAEQLGSTGINQVREVNAYLKNQQSATKAEVDRLLKTIQSLVFYYDDCEDTETVDSIVDKAIKLTERRDEVKRLLDVIKRNTNLKKRVDALGVCGVYVTNNVKYQELKKILEAVNSKISKLRDELSELERQNAVLNHQLADKREVIKGGGICPYSKSICESITGLVDEFKKDIVRLQGELNAVNNTYSEKLQELKKAQADSEILRNDMSGIEEAYRTKALLERDIDNFALVYDANILANELMELNRTYDEYNAMIKKVHANAEYNKLIDKLTSDKFKAEQNVEILKVWIKLTDVNGLQSQLMNKPFEDLAVSISDYLEAFFDDTVIGIIPRHAKFCLSDKANSFSFGIHTRDVGYIPFEMLSSGEKCLFTLAMMISIADNSKTQLPLVLIDDLLDHLDSDRIENLFNRLHWYSKRTDGKQTAQIILAGVQLCNHPSADDFVIRVKP